MLTIRYRPRKLSDIIGQSPAVSVIRAVVRSLAASPRTIILHGPAGTGKTSLARVFSSSLLCPFPVDGDPCLQCAFCADDIEGSSMHTEYDVGQVGNKDWVLGFRERLEYTQPVVGRYRMVILDEAQEASKAAQGVLLELLSGQLPRTFFVLCTTEPGKLIDGIRSRAIEIAVQTVPDAELIPYLTKIAALENIQISDVAIAAIARHSRGHVRNALQSLDLAKLLNNEEAFLPLVASSAMLIEDFIAAAKARDHTAAQVAINMLLHQPLAQLEIDLEDAVLAKVKSFATGANTDKAAGADAAKMMQALSGEYAERCFKSDVLAQALLWSMYYELGKTAVVKSVAPSAAGFDR